MNEAPSGHSYTMLLLPHLYNAESYLHNIDLEEVELIYNEITYTTKYFSNGFKEFSEFNLASFNVDMS